MENPQNKCANGDCGDYATWIQENIIKKPNVSHDQDLQTLYKQAAEERMKQIDEETHQAKKIFEQANEERTQLAHMMLKQMPELKQLNKKKTKKAKQMLSKHKEFRK